MNPPTTACPEYDLVDKGNSMSATLDGSLLMLIEVSLKVALLAITAAALLFVLPIRNPNVHHRVWLTVLAAMLCLPILQSFSPRISISVPAYLRFGEAQESNSRAGTDLADPAAVPTVTSNFASHLANPGHSADVSDSSIAASQSTVPSEPHNDAWQDGLSRQSNVATSANSIALGATQSDVRNAPHGFLPEMLFLSDTKRWEYQTE